MNQTQRLRRVLQTLVLAAVVVTGIRHAAGWSRTSIETYCPFGGLESALSLLTERSFTCAMGERNLALLLALLVLTLLSRKSFCGWVCPVGALSEWSATLGRRLLPRRRRDTDGSPLHALEPSRRLDRLLRWLRLPVLVVILALTYRTGELIFRAVDPYYVLFSMNGHDVRPWSYAVLAVLTVTVVLLPMAWCRYLCPLAITLWPLARIGLLRLRRDQHTCSGCGACDRACPQSIVVSRVEQVCSGECSLCFACTAVCPEAGALSLVTAGKLVNGSTPATVSTETTGSTGTTGLEAGA